MKLTPEEIDIFKRVARHNPEFVQVIERWYMHELVQLPSVGKQIVETMQGRSQVLAEMRDKLQAV